MKSQKDFRSAAQDSTSKVTSLEITEPVDPKTGECPHQLLTPDVKNASNCILPGRIDMFGHYAMTGGKWGAKVKSNRNSAQLDSLIVMSSSSRFKLEF